jgi:DNA-binding GntR family transcriptional regulator
LEGGWEHGPPNCTHFCVPWSFRSCLSTPPTKTTEPLSSTRIRSVERIHEQLRAAIMNGEFGPGAVLSQVALARTFGVSRTPLREAIRRLEAEGLVESLENRRARVAAIDAESLDVLYTERILVEAMGVKVTVPQLTEIDLNDLLAMTAALRIATERRDVEARDGARRALHQLYVARAGQRLRATIATAFDACERYRRLYADFPPGALDAYGAIAGACIARDADAASLTIARLEVRLARAILAAVGGTYEPVAICTALQMLEGARTL